ncbi:ARHGJ factor, partial [Atractosteus spatula]|nr:ARHGJ factor [Atractosteus spatula]
MLPGYGFPPLPGFQPPLQAFPYPGESADMWIPSSPESPALSEGLKDRPFPRHPHIAVCQQETLTFIELPSLPAEASRGRSPSPDGEGRPRAGGPAEAVCSSGGAADADGGSGDSDGTSAGPVRADSEGTSGVRRNRLGVFHPVAAHGRRGRVVHPHGLCVSGRKMRVYSPESLSDESLSSPSLECEYLFPGPFLEEELGLGALPHCPAPPAGGAEDASQGEVTAATPPGLRLEGKCGAGPEGPEESVAVDTAGPSSRGADQERRRFSASELISRLQLSQRKSSFTLKLGKSLSARVAPKERVGPRSLSPDIHLLDLLTSSACDSRHDGSLPPQSRHCRAGAGSFTGVCKHSSRDRSSAGSIDSAPHSPMGPAPPPPGDSSAALHRGSTRARKDSIEEGVCTPASFSCTKRLSRFLPSSILYQEYSDVAINREIQRQQGAEPGAEEEEEGEGRGEAPPTCNLSPTNSFRSQRSSRGSAFSLWQDIPDVRSSGLLDTFSNEERKLAKFELVTSEASYIRSLSIAVDHFMLSRDLSECLGAQERQWLFSKLPDVKDVSERFLQDLEERLEEDILRFDVCDIVLAHCPAFRRVYLPYVTNQAYQEQTYQRLLHENSRFPGILARLEEDPVCQRLPLTSFLILPFQRITRLKMLVENILKRTAPGSRDEDTATKAFNELKKLIRECNSSVQSMKRTEELIHLNKKIHFEGKIFPLISQSRWLVKHGELLEVDTQTMSISGSKFKLPTRPVYLHLFNDCLLLSRKKDSWKFVVFVHAKIGALKVKDLSLKLQGITGYIFHLQLCDDQQLKHQILLKAHTESEKQRWITAMLPSARETSRAQISENEDLSQVQCIRSYKALEHDELTLEKADILQVQTTASDGWVEGIRLSDGERGWFPKSYVEEISSRSARLRNLRENNRIKCATQKLEEEYL